MPLAPYEEYDKRADGQAEAKYKRWLIPLVAMFALIGGAIGGGTSGDSWLIGLLIGAAIGMVAGWLAHRVLIGVGSSNAAAQQYTDDWCIENGCQFRGDNYSPENGPHHSDGFKRKATDAVEGKLGEFDVLFYNFSYWTKSSNGKTTTDVEHPFRIVRLTGKTLPIARLSWSKRGFMGRVALFDKIAEVATPERHVSLESTEFNDKFDLTIDDKADDIWIRRIFDPATIQACLNGTINIPDLRYYDGAWWLIEGSHFHAKDLDTMKEWQARAAVAIDYLARVQEL
jgi:hypothetical protein